MALTRLAVLTALGLTLAPSVALADCPDGWFCDTPPAAPSSPGATPEPDPREEPDEPDEPREHRGHRQHHRIELEPPDFPPPPPPRRPRHRSEIGVNVHLTLGVLGADAAEDAWLGGGGFAFRLRPVPMIAVDLGLELVGGTDYNGNDRAEQAFVGNVLVFLNARDRVQCFLLGGFNVGGAGVRVREQGGVTVPPRNETYTYVGAQLGVGLEWRVTRRAAVTTDFQLFARGRTDADRVNHPEYVDPGTHLATNASGGGVLRLGATFYF